MRSQAHTHPKTPPASASAVDPEPKPRHVLIVDDDTRTVSLLTRYLQGEGYAVTTLMNGLQVEPEVRLREPSLVLMDFTLPGRDGVDVCRDLRRFSAVPIIMVTARGDELARLAGLDGGADDYVCKPFSPRELLARIEAVLRRAEGRLGTGAPTAQHGFRVDPQAQRIQLDGQWLPLTPIEYRLLCKLLSRPGHVFSRESLMERTHDGYRQNTERAVDSHIKNLRRKIARVRGHAAAIVSVYGMGYRFDPGAA